MRIRDREDPVAIGQRREIPAVYDRGERVDRFVLAKNLVAVSGEAGTQRRPAARADANDDALRVGRAVVEHGAELRVEPLGAMLKRATPGGSHPGIRDGEDRYDRYEPDREMSKHSSHAISPTCRKAPGCRVQKRHDQNRVGKAEQLRRQSRSNN